MPLTFFLRSLWYDRYINTAVMFGVVCAVAVLTGALFVGDSMRGSLKALTLDRLGNIDTILFSQQFIESEPQSEDCESRPSGRGSDSEPVILLPAAVEYNGRISGVQLLGCNMVRHLNRTGEFESSGEFFDKIANTVYANQALADAVGLQAGGTLSLRVMSPQSIPPESSLGRKDHLIRTRVQVDEIIPNSGIGRFSLKMDQQAEPLLIVPIAQVQRLLKVGDKVNAVFYYGDSPEISFTPTLENLGIITEHHDGNWYIKSARMLFNDAQAESILAAIKESGTDRSAVPGLLYLATSIRAVKNNSETPYSTIYATNTLSDSTLSEPQSLDCGHGSPQSKDCGSVNVVDNIALNQWTADDLDVQIGDEIELTWFAPDDVSVTHTKTFTLEKIFPMEGLGANPHVVPTVEGFTDETSIADWNPPFPFDAKRIRQKDEDYWDEYRAAPKAFVSLETGQELFGSRFGKIATFVLSEPAAASPVSVATQSPDLFGITLVPVREQGLAASSGTTPFSVLFLSFSFFIIAAALMLVMLLFRLSVEIKAKRLGIMLAVGWSPKLVTKTLLVEGLLISLLGSLFGTFLGIGYAGVMVYGLTTWWVDAVTTPFLTLHIKPLSLVIGFASGVVFSVLTIIWSVRGITKIPVRSLLFGNAVLR